MDVEHLMQVLSDAEKESQPVGSLSDSVPGGLSLAEAHDICEGIVERRVDGGDKLAGFKVGFTNIPVREKMGLPDSTYGYLLDSMLLASDSTVPMSQLIGPRMECEICFRFKKALAGKNLSVDDVLDAADSVCASFEIPDSRLKDWQCPFPDIFADNGFSGRVVLSGAWLPVKDVDLLAESVTLVKDQEVLAQGKGEMAMGHPAKAVSWLAGKLDDRGKGIKAGQIVMTGTLTPIIPAEKGSKYTATFSTLGEVRIAFE